MKSLVFSFFIGCSLGGLAYSQDGIEPKSPTLSRTYITEFQQISYGNGTVGDYNFQAECKNGNVKNIYPDEVYVNSTMTGVNVHTLCSNDQGFRRWKTVQNNSAGEEIPENMN